MGIINANELKKKMHLLVDGQPYAVIEVTFSSPSARGASTMVRAKLRNLLTGLVQEKNFKTGEKFDEPDVEEVAATYLYAAPGEYHFMDETSYDQFMLREDQLSELKWYLKEGLALKALKYNGSVVSLDLPVYVELKVASTEPAIKGASASGGSTKKAVLETGLEVKVPMYVEDGETVRVNTQTGEVAGRA